MNLFKIARSKSDIALYTVLVDWLYCLPNGRLFSKQECSVLACLLGSYFNILESMNIAKTAKPSLRNSLVAFELVFSNASKIAICDYLHISTGCFEVVKHNLKKKGALVYKDLCYSIDSFYIPKFQKDGSIKIQTIIKVE